MSLHSIHGDRWLLMSETITFRLNGIEITAPAGVTVAAALWNAGYRVLRMSTGGQWRGVLCAMGVCFECRVQIDGRRHRRACMTIAESGMEIVTDE